MTNITKGVFPPITTPFTDADEVDYESLSENIQRLESGGVDGIVSCGSTGERSTLRPEEHRQVIKQTVDTATKPVIAGTGSPSTWETIELTQFAGKVGADGALVLAPYYTSPSDADLVRHYEEVADSADIPIILYNYPSAIGINLNADVVVELADHENIVGVKDSLGDLQQIDEIARRTKEFDFDVMSGWDSLLWPGMNIGATGLVGITGVVFPEDMAELYKASKNNNREKAQEIHERVAEFEQALLIKNPQITVSAAQEILGHTSGNVRKPQYPLNESQKNELKKAVEAFQEARK